MPAQGTTNKQLDSKTNSTHCNATVTTVRTIVWQLNRWAPHPLHDAIDLTAHSNYRLACTRRCRKEDEKRLRISRASFLSRLRHLHTHRQRFSLFSIPGRTRFDFVRRTDCIDSSVSHTNFFIESLPTNNDRVTTLCLPRACVVGHTNARLDDQCIRDACKGRSQRRCHESQVARARHVNALFLQCTLHLPGHGHRHVVAHGVRSSSKTQSPSKLNPLRFRYKLAPTLSGSIDRVNLIYSQQRSRMKN